MSYDIASLRQKAEAVYPDAVAWRRHIHSHPELSEQEVETEAYICGILDELGISYRRDVAGHGVAATIYGKDRNHGVGIRADIDALPVTEVVDVPFRSQHEGVMHACGHDVHTAVLLGTAKVLQGMREELPGCVRLLFQPSEETIGGARQMIEAGCLTDPTIGSVISLHVEPTVEAGKIQFIPGSMNAASCGFEVRVIGASCHGAHPTKGVDALLPACNMISALQTIVSRRIDPTEAALVTVGTFHSGTAGNIISGEAEFTGIIRTLDNDRRAFLREQVSQICEGIAAAYNTKCEIAFHESYPALVNDKTLFDWVRGTAEAVLGADNVVIENTPSLGADDFAYFCSGPSRGLYYNLGTRVPGSQVSYPLHSDHFCPDERAIVTGILTEVASVLTILEKEAPTW